MLISKAVKVKWCPHNKKRYESLGYVFTKMGDEFEVKVEDLTNNSTKRVNCICDNCNKYLFWEYRKYLLYVKEEGKTYCKKCGINLIGTEKRIKGLIKKSKSFYEWCIENNRQDVLDRWDYELNGCSPSEVCYKTNKPRWFKCNKHSEHKSELKYINNFINGQEGSMDCSQCNSVAQYILDNFPNKRLEEVWDYEKNEDSDPWNIGSKSTLFIWIKCQEDKGHNSYKKRSYSFTNGQRCPICSQQKEDSSYERKTKIYLKELGYKVLTEHNCTIRPINPKTKQPLPFDNEIELKNGKHLIIEVHGGQHYKIDFYKTKCNCSNEESYKMLYQRKLYDRYKRIKCIQAGYEYLELPYTAFDEKETYRNLIDNKIKEILDELD